MSVPRVALDLDGLNLDGHAQSPAPGSPMRSVAAESAVEGVEEEKCVVAQYRTSAQQRSAFSRLLSHCSRDAIPVEWVIDIADESNGWFYATAYHYNDNTQMLHVMVPDKYNPTFEGHVQLDHRTVHLIECVDGGSAALFNKIVRDSIIKIKWSLEWYEEPENGVVAGNNGWINSFARYYIRMANQLLVEDKDVGSDSRGFVIITADVSVRLLECLKGKGDEDFSRLINESVVSASEDAAQYARAVLAAKRSPDPREKGPAGSAHATAAATSAPHAEVLAGGGARPEDADALRKLVDLSKGLRECVDDLTDERVKRKDDLSSLSALFQEFALGGDLDCGLRLLDQTAAKPDEDERMEAIAEDAKYLSHRLERSLGKAVAGGVAVGLPAGDDEEQQRLVRRLRQELEDKERELRALRVR